jgi:hypothetical protein
MSLLLERIIANHRLVLLLRLNTHYLITYQNDPFAVYVLFKID